MRQYFDVNFEKRAVSLRQRVFVNVRNEWGEGCHLEPDQRYGRQYLDALRDGLAHPQPTTSVLCS